jgi:type II secretion system (T2SS) protein E
MKLGSWLIARGKITGVQLKRSLLDQSFYGGYLSSSLIKLGYVDEETLGQYLSETFQAPFAPAEKFSDISPEVLRMVPRPMAGKHQVIPLAVAGRKLQLAIMNPRDILVLDEIAFLTGLQVEAWVSSENVLLDALEKYYQFPRPFRETIPLADRDEAVDGEDRAQPEPLPSPLPTAPAPSTSTRDELGLDGRPISAGGDAEYQAIPEAAAPRPESSSVPLPRTIEEWREQETAQESAAVPSPAVSGGPGPRGPALEHEPAFRLGRSAGTAAKPSLTLVPPAPPASLEELSQRLKNSVGRDEIFEALVAFSGARFVRTALFVVMQEKVIGWGGRGEGFDPGRIRATTIAFSASSIFSYFRMGSEFYFGPVPDLPANRQFYRDLGTVVPDRVLLIPIHIKGRLIALLYGDNGTGRREEPDILLFRRLAQKASLALEILILRNKIEMI